MIISVRTDAVFPLVFENQYIGSILQTVLKVLLLIWLSILLLIGPVSSMKVIYGRGGVEGIQSKSHTVTFFFVFLESSPTVVVPGAQPETCIQLGYSIETHPPTLVRIINSNPIAVRMPRLKLAYVHPSKNSLPTFILVLLIVTAYQCQMRPVVLLLT